MTRENILKKLEEIFREVLDDEIQLSEKTVLRDINNWDSLQNIHILVAIEEEFGVRVSVEKAASLEMIDQIIDVILWRKQ